jgi:ABC-type phosphate/phosphonate transport system permease subunit
LAVAGEVLRLSVMASRWILGTSPCLVNQHAKYGILTAALPYSRCNRIVMMLLISSYDSWPGHLGAIMTTLQAILIGGALAWLLALVVLAFFLRNTPELEETD